MREIGLKEARARLSHVLDEAIAGKPPIITRHGRREAVLLSYREFKPLSRVPSFGWLLTNAPLDVGGTRPD